MRSAPEIEGVRKRKRAVPEYACRTLSAVSKLASLQTTQASQLPRKKALERLGFRT